MSRTLPATYLDRVDLDRIRELAGNFFVSLEEVLKTALWFTTWALLRDHFKEGYHLRYSAGQANEFFAQWIARHHVRFEADRVDKMALAEILTCFGSLGQFLTTIGEQRTSHARPRGDWPRIARESSSPFDFPFAHIYPFLDLNSESQKTLTSLVSTTPSKLLSAGVVDVRNGLLHHSDEMPMRDAIESAVDAVDARIAELVSAGIYPMVYLLQNSDEDRFGRERILLKSLGGPEVLLTRPTSLDTSAFPSRTSPQVIFARARIGPSGEPLRFSYLKDSSYQEMWRDFPKRPVAQGAIAHSKATQRRAV